MKRIPELDAVRGLAALAIVIFHVDRHGFFFGWTGVNLFFVLSGYLITSIILRNGGRAGFLRHFYVRRALRIWPIYYLAILIVIALNGLLKTPFSPQTLPFYLTFTQNVEKFWGGSLAAPHPALIHTWTLAIEEQFYIVGPVLVLLAGQRGLPVLASMVIAASFIARASGLSLALLPCQADGFALGGLLAAWLGVGQMAPARKLRLTAVFILACVASLLFHAVTWWQFGEPVSLLPPEPHYPAWSIGFINLFFFGVVGLLLLYASRPGLALLRDRRLVYLGLISYGIYLYHPIVFYMVETGLLRAGFGAPGWGEALKVILSLGVAVASWRWIEQPILAWKERFEYRPLKSNAGPAETIVPGARRDLSIAGSREFVETAKSVV